jgi:hypothetical protein
MPLTATAIPQTTTDPAGDSRTRHWLSTTHPPAVEDATERDARQDHERRAEQ